MIKRGLAVLVAVLSLGVVAAPASAEWFADLFAGVSLTRDHDVKLNDVGIGRVTGEDVEFDRSLAWGGRVGRYFDALPFLGLGVDFFRYNPDIPIQSVGLSVSSRATKRARSRTKRSRHALSSICKRRSSAS